MRCVVVFFLDDKHWTVMMEEILICWVAGAECYMHATAQETFAMAMLSDAVQAHSVRDNAMVERPESPTSAMAL
jgi:hypothetical protein